MGGIIGGAIEGITGKGAAEASENASNSASRLSRTQEEMLRQNLPFLRALGEMAGSAAPSIFEDAMGAYRRGREFDPAQETARAMQAFDSAQRESLQRDLGNTNTPFSMRGFTQGNASSDQAGANGDLLSRRAFDRGQYAANLQLRETDRRDEVTGRASDRLARGFGLLDPTGRTSATAGALQGAANTQLGLAQNYGNQASNANPGALIPLVGNALRGVQMPWQKRTGGSGGAFDWMGNIHG